MLDSKKVKEIMKNVPLPTAEDWEALRDMVQKDGLYHAYRHAIAPTGSISTCRWRTLQSSPSLRLRTARRCTRLTT